MKNIPVYMSAGGTATLILQEIPRSGKAYILLQTIAENGLEQLLSDCGSFCRDAGAEELFVSQGEAHLPLEPAYDILILAVQKAELPAFSPVQLEPLDHSNGDAYIDIYNRCFSDISHAVSYDRSQLRRIEAQQQQGFLARNQAGAYIGMGELHDNELAAVAVLPEFRGIGADLTGTLLSLCPGPEILLTVASDNNRALKLYDRLGFHVRKAESRWYRL